MTDLQKYIERNSDLECLTDTSQYKNRFQIKSESSNRLYVVAQRISDDVLTCSCPGWIRARNGHLNRKCKHTDVLSPLLAAAEKFVKQRQLS